MFRTAIAQAHKTEYHCAEKALASGSVQTAAGHGVPTSIQDPLFSWRYRQSHEERDVSLRSRASIQQHAKPPGRIQNIGSLHSTSQQSDTGLDAEQRPMACLFPGSGSQFPNMGSFLFKDFKAARDTWEEAEEALSDFDNWKEELQLASDPALASLKLSEWQPWLEKHPPDHLRRTVFGKTPASLLMKSSNSQPAILITSIAYLRVVEKEFGIPLASKYARFFVGHSTGEYSAAVAAGSLSFKDAVRLTRLHGFLTSRTLMVSQLESPVSEDALPTRKAQMSALVINPCHSFEEIAAVVQCVSEQYGPNSGEGTVSIAAYNSSSQVVLSGTKAGIENACSQLESKAIASKATDLPTWVPFHTPMMRPAEDGVRLALQRSIQVNPTRPNTSLVSCMNGQLVSTPSDISECLVQQMSEPVRWSLALANLRHVFQAREFVYLGPHKALASLASRESQQLGLPDEVFSVASRDGLEKVVQRFSGSSS